MRRCPHLYEINACVFLKRMSRKYGRTLTLATIPDEGWQYFARLGFDLLWLMGVWERSPGARAKVLLDPVLHRAYDQALPGWTDDDVGGSPYAIYAYSLDSSLGKPRELAQLKQKLNQHGLGLVLDFVPNHVAFDHPWTLSHPDWFVQGRKVDVRTHPDWFFSSDRDIYLAHGRDPNFPPWTDTGQVNFYFKDLRQALINELLQIAEIADGVRCDMAMLALNDVFEQVWGETISYLRRPELEFWTEAIERLKKRRPGFLFLAEVYWDLEHKLQQLGFDFTYDKTFYDRLLSSDAGDIRRCLMMDECYQQHSVRFIENHDEPRAVTAFGRERSLAAAAILATVPGLRFFHDGQFEGRRIRLPIQLVREPEEATDVEIRQFYHRLMEVCNALTFHHGEWKLMEVSPADKENGSHHNLLAWNWQCGEQLKVVIVNYSRDPSQGWLKLPAPSKITDQEILCGHLTATRDVALVDGQQLDVHLSPWEALILDIDLSYPL